MPEPYDLSQKNVLVAVFAMPDCPACEDYVPRFLRYAAPYQQAGMPVFVYDVASENPALQRFADKYEIRATPTTLVLPRGKGFIKVTGPLDDAAIDRLLRQAYAYHTGHSTLRPV